MVKMVTKATFFDREYAKVREVGEEFETNNERAALLEFRNLAQKKPDEEKKPKKKATLD